MTDTGVVIVRTKAVIVVGRPVEEVFDYAVAANNLAKLFRGYGPIPAIERVTLDADELAVGVIRTIHNSDGSNVGEKILVLERPRRHEYRLVSGIKAPFKWLVRVGEGRWTFEPSERGTHVAWHYEFELTSPFAYPPAAILIKTFFRTAMKRCLRRLGEQLGEP